MNGSSAYKPRLEFISGFIHDIKSHLNSIIGLSSLMSGHLDSSAYQKDPEKCACLLNRSSSYLKALMDDFLTLLCVENESIHVMEETFSVPELIEEVVECNRSLLCRNVSLCHDISENVPPLMACDRKILRRILSNLISNSCKFTRKGEIIIRVRRGSARGTDRLDLRFTVKDTGSGMDDNTKKLIFEPFIGFYEDDRIRYSSDGLGLSVVRKMIDILGGQIAVRSSRGKGTCFLLNIPMKIPEKMCQLF